MHIVFLKKQSFMYFQNLFQTEAQKKHGVTSSLRLLSPTGLVFCIGFVKLSYCITLHIFCLIISYFFHKKL